MTAAPTTPAMPPVGAPPTPKSKLSGATLLVLVIVVVLVLGGIGVLVAQAVKSDPTPTKPVGPAANPAGVTLRGRGTFCAERNREREHRKLEQRRRRRRRSPV